MGSHKIWVQIFHLTTEQYLAKKQSSLEYLFQYCRPFNRTVNRKEKTIRFWINQQKIVPAILDYHYLKIKEMELRCVCTSIPQTKCWIYTAFKMGYTTHYIFGKYNVKIVFHVCLWALKLQKQLSTTTKFLMSEPWWNFVLWNPMIDGETSSPSRRVGPPDSP
jgi:hypothetical protein